MWRMANTLAMLVAVMTASNSRKLPKVSRPIESGNDRIRCKIAVSAGGMVNETGFKTAIYTMYSVSRGTSCHGNQASFGRGNGGFSTAARKRTRRKIVRTSDLGH
jgi:hypothetical protein